MEIFEDERTVSRADLAAWLRQLAGQLESDGKVLFGAAGSVTVSDEVHCELEIESSGSETSIEIEFSWTDAGLVKATKAGTAEDEEDESDKEEDEDADESGGDEDAEESGGDEDAEESGGEEGGEDESDEDADEEAAAPLNESSAAPVTEPDNSAEEDKGNDAMPR